MLTQCVIDSVFFNLKRTAKSKKGQFPLFKVGKLIFGVEREENYKEKEIEKKENDKERERQINIFYPSAIVPQAFIDVGINRPKKILKII